MHLLYPLVFVLSLGGCGAGSSKSPTQPDAPVTVSSVSLSGTVSFTGLNQAVQLAAIAEMSDHTTRDVTGLSVWQSSDGAVLTVSPGGLVTAIGYGTATVAATYQGKAGTAQGTVPRPAVCDGSLMFSSQTFGSAGGTGTVGVTVSPSGCEWTATSGSLWIAVTAGSRGGGSGSVSYLVSSYSGSSQRQGTLEIAGKTLVIRQDPPAQPGPQPASCQYGLTSTKTVSFGSQGGTGTVTFNLTSGSCTWTASSSDPQWLTVQQQSGTGNIVIGFSVAANPSSSGRSGRVEVRWPGPQVGENILINQSGR